MATTTATTTAQAVTLPEPGTVVTARMWFGGKAEQRPERGVVLYQYSDNTVLVWFPRRGRVQDAGTAVQRVFGHEVLSRAELEDAARTWLVRISRAARREGFMRDLAPAAFARLCAAGKAAQAATRAARR